MKKKHRPKTHCVDFKKGANLLCNRKPFEGHWILEPDSFFIDMKIKTEYKKLCKNCVKKLLKKYL